MVRLLIIALIFGFAGFLLESIGGSLVSGRLIYAGDKFFWGLPILPIYSVGGLLMHLCIRNLQNSSPQIIVLVSWLSVCGWELVAGAFCDKILGQRFWDYRYHRYNLSGYICASNCLIWLLLVVLYYYFLFPLVDSYLSGH